jgi:hypothetical protein
MKRLFEISSEEKQRILEMHESATKRNYLNEQTAQPAASNIKRTFVLDIEPNEFGLDKKTANTFLTFARASSQFVFNNVYYALRRRGELPTEPMNWNERNLSWLAYGFNISMGYPFFSEYSPTNHVYVSNFTETGAQPNITSKCNIKYVNPKKTFNSTNAEVVLRGGALDALSTNAYNLNGMVGGQSTSQKIDTVKMTELLDKLITQESYNTAFKKLWLPKLTPNSVVSNDQIKTIQSSWFYGWLKSKYGSSQPTGAQPTGAQPTGTQPTGTTTAR